jgi:hypothetical protein
VANNTLRVLIDRVQELTDRVDPKYRGRVLAAISRAVEYWAARLPWASLRREETFIANGTQYLTFPERVRSVITITDKNTGREVNPGTNWSRRAGSIHAAKSSAGGYYEWRDVGYEPVIQQPTSPGKLQVRCDVSEAIEVRFEGLLHDSNASGTSMEYRPTSEVVTMGGTSATNTVSTYAEVVSLEKEPNTTGYIQVLDAEDKIIAHIRPTEERAQYRRIQFLGVPTAGTPFLVEYYRRPPQLTSEDQAIDPSVDTEFLIWRAAGDMHWIAKAQQAANQAWGKSDEYLGARISEMQNHGARPQQTEPSFTYLGFENEDFGVDTEFGAV